jgi:hypothetical protein
MPVCAAEHIVVELQRDVLALIERFVDCVCGVGPQACCAGRDKAGENTLSDGFMVTEKT